MPNGDWGGETSNPATMPSGGGTDWGKLITAILTIAGPPAAAAVIGNKAQGNALQLSQENLTTARDKSIDAVRQYVEGAKPFIDWNYKQGQAGQDWAWDNAQNAKNWAFSNASATRGNALTKSLDALNQGFKGAQTYLTPYSTTGENALTRLNSRSAGARGVSVAGPSSMKTGSAPFQFNLAPGAGQTSLPPAVKPYPTSGGDGSTGAGMPEFKMPGATGGTASAGGTTNALTNALASSKVKPSVAGFVAGGAGAAAGGAMGHVIGPGLAKLTGISALGGPVGLAIGAAVGALVGPLVGHFTRRGREKEGASKVANDLGTWMEGLYSEMKAGGNPALTPEVYQAAVKEAYAAYGNWLRGNLKDDFVVNNSLQSQGGFITDSMHKKGFSDFSLA